MLPEETLRRATVRDVDPFGSHEEVERRYLGRYLLAQTLYRAEVAPEAVADVVVNNDRVDVLKIDRWMVPDIDALRRGKR